MLPLAGDNGPEHAEEHGVNGRLVEGAVPELPVHGLDIDGTGRPLYPEPLILRTQHESAR